MKKVLITGVTSFLGSNLAKCLLNEGHKVYGVVRPNSRNISAVKAIKSLDIVSLDLDECKDEYELTHKLQDKGIKSVDIWMHFSWDGIGSLGRSNKEIQQKNILNSQKCFKTAEALSTKRFLFAGSQAEYGNGTKKHPLPISEYGKAKLLFGEWAMKQNSLMEFVHLRIFSVYGPGDHENSLVNSCIRNFTRGNDMELGPCTQVWNYMDIRDCADAIATIINSKETVTGVYEIASESEKKLSEYVEQIWMICGKKGKCLFGKRDNNAEGAIDLRADVSRLKELGFTEKISFEEGIKNIIDSGLI